MSPANVPKWSVAIILAVVGLSTAAAQDRPRTFDFPQDPRQWINSPPWSVKQLQGKAALMLFFEEQCPRCQRRWTEFNALAQQHADDPILFVAVSSGTQRGEMEGYVRRNNVNWAMLLDPDRSFEKACDIHEISLENIMQVAVITADGTLKPGSWQNLEESVATALADARWTVDPKTIPPALKPAWQQIEFQNYAPAATLIRKSLKSSKDELRTAAEALMAVVQPLIDAQVAAAEGAYDAGKKWAAYRAYHDLAERFKGYELPENAESRKKELQSDPTVKAEIAAMKAFDNAQRLLNQPMSQKKAIGALKKLAKEKPDTEAGQKAQSLLGEMGVN